MTKSEWKEYLLTIGFIDTRPMPESEERLVREVISELGNEGIMFVPKGKVYENADRLPRAEAEKFFDKQARAWLTQYFNKILPGRKYLSEQVNAEIHGVKLV